MNKNKEDFVKGWLFARWIFLGLVMLIPGLLKLFVMGPKAVSMMLSNISIFAWAPGVFAWLLILIEIVSGVMILAKWKVNYASFAGALIILLATLTVHVKWSAIGATGWSNVILHLIVFAEFIIMGIRGIELK